MEEEWCFSVGTVIGSFSFKWIQDDALTSVGFFVSVWSDFFALLLFSSSAFCNFTQVSPRALAKWSSTATKGWNIRKNQMFYDFQFLTCVTFHFHILLKGLDRIIHFGRVFLGFWALITTRLLLRDFRRCRFGRWRRFRLWAGFFLEQWLVIGTQRSPKMLIQQRIRWGIYHEKKLLVHRHTKNSMPEEIFRHTCDDSDFLDFRLLLGNFLQNPGRRCGFGRIGALDRGVLVGGRGRPREGRRGRAGTVLRGWPEMRARGRGWP